MSEGNPTEFRDKKQFTILSQTEIGRGGNGVVYKIEALTDGKVSKYAMKEYTGNATKQRAAQAVSMHLTLEGANIKVLPIYHLLDEGSAKIIMTLHDPDNVFVIDGKPAYKKMEPAEPPPEEMTENIFEFGCFLN